MKKILFMLFLSGIVLSSCKKEEPTPTTETETPDSTPAPVTASSSPQFSGKIDGASVSYVSGYYVDWESNGNVSTVTGEPSTFIYGFGVIDSNFEPVISIKKGTLTLPNGWYPTNSEFAAFFPVGDSSYDPLLQNGVEVFMVDNLGVEWSTKNGSADQTGSTFKILERVEGTFNGDYQVKVKISLSCKLYDNSGNVKTLTEGIMVGSFANM